MAYERINWQNGEVGNTPLNANNLNRMDMTLEEHDQKIGDHDYEIENLKTGAQGITEEINKKMDRINPQGSGTLSIPAVNADNITAQTVEADEIKVTKVGSKGGTAPVVFDNDILVSGITTPIGSLASSANSKAESASGRAEEAYTLASRANREAASAINKANDNRVIIDKHTGLIGEGVGSKEVPALGYLDGYYIAPNGRVTQYNATATVISIDFLDFFFNGDNIIFNHVDLLPTENCIPCAWYDISGNFISAADVNIIAEFDEQTSKITKQYIDYCIIPVPAGASSCKLSGLANGRADIRIQTSLSEAIKDLQSKPEPAALVLTNPSPLPITDGKKILGIDALGKSEQKTTIETVQGQVANTSGAINQELTANSARCSSDVIYLPKGVSISVTSGYEIYIMKSDSASGNISEKYTWANPNPTTNDGYWRYMVRKTDGSNLTPSSFVLSMSPTPSNPIEIIDASNLLEAIGKNLFNPSYGYHTSASGFVNNYQGAIGSGTDLIPCKSGDAYVFTMSEWSGAVIWVGYYNASKGFINRVAITNGATITIPSGASYFFVSVYASNITASSYPQIMLERGSTASAYVPYQSNSVSLPFEPKSAGSVANELIINADRTGKIIRRVGVKVFNYVDGLNDANLETAYARVNLTDSALVNYSTEYMTSHALPNSIKANNTAEGSYFYSNTMRFRKNDLRTKADWDNWIAQNPITVYYPLRVPVETTLTAEEVAAVLQLMTYKGTTTIESEMDIKSVTYPGDIKAYVDDKFVYSYTIRKIGKWADNKDLYQIVVNTTTPSAGTDGLVSNLVTSNNCSIKRISGIVKSGNAYSPISDYYNPSTYNSIWVDGGGIKMHSSTSDYYANRPCEIIVEYTLKDSAPAAASVLSLDETEE